LGQAIEALRSEGLTEVDADRLADSIVELRSELDLLEVEWTRRVAVLDPELSGHPSSTAFLKDRCRMSAARAQRAVVLGNQLPRLPFVGKALEAGNLSLDQAHVLTDLPERLSGEFSRDEVTLVNTVGLLSVADTRRVVDGPGTETTAEDLFDRRYLFGSKTLDGMVKLDGLLDPVAGDLVLTALQAATPPRRDGDHRTPRQRRADALSDMARTFLDSGQASGTEKPHVLVLTDLDALQGHGGGIHETGSGQVLTPGQVRETACDAVINRVVFGPDSQPVDLGSTTRIVPPPCGEPSSPGIGTAGTKVVTGPPNGATPTMFNIGPTGDPPPSGISNSSAATTTPSNTRQPKTKGREFAATPSGTHRVNTLE
jgi:hypothetical protein